MNGASKYMGWVQLAGGVAAIFIEIWNSVHTGTGNISVGTAGVGLAAGGVAHVMRSK